MRTSASPFERKRHFCATSSHATTLARSPFLSAWGATSPCVLTSCPMAMYTASGETPLSLAIGLPDWALVSWNRSSRPASSRCQCSVSCKSKTKVSVSASTLPPFSASPTGTVSGTATVLVMSPYAVSAGALGLNALLRQAKGMRVVYALQARPPPGRSPLPNVWLVHRG